jgi:hypothetical protein
MNAVEIEEAISALAEQPFDPATFPYAFLEAFGRKDTTLKRLRSGDMNKSDVGGVLQRDNIHIAVAAPGAVSQTMADLRASPATARWKAKFIVATDGESFEAEELGSLDAPIVCAYRDFPDHFGFFLPLAGISTVKQIRESAFDIKATGRLNRLYVELLKLNPDWDTEARRHDMNHFMARLIFCFFAEDTGIFIGDGFFTDTVAQMSAKDAGNTHAVIEAIFRAMNTKGADRAAAGLPRWVDAFPYVNGGLFSGSHSPSEDGRSSERPMEVPIFSKIARSYLLNVGVLDWKKINPDIFGSMIQAVADDEERGALGMHYTSVPNILKVLNPLFLDDLRASLAEAGDNPRKLLNLRGRMAKIRVFDPACGSGNFLVIAYREMRAIEAEINQRRGEPERRTDIPLTNFRGIELRGFPAEIARLALIIAEYQADVRYRGPKMALAEFLPLSDQNWITCGNALRLDWLSLCPPTGTGVKFHADDLFAQPLEQAQIDFENEGGETYICGNPPYLGRKYQSDEQKSELKGVFAGRCKDLLSLDYVSGWFMKASDYMAQTMADAAFVTTNSICQGIQVSALWPTLMASGTAIGFAYQSFKWANLASHNAGVTVSIIGLTKVQNRTRKLFSVDANDKITMREATNINAYLVPSENVFVLPANKTSDGRGQMQFGNHPYYANALMLRTSEADKLRNEDSRIKEFLRPLYGSQEFISCAPRVCIWIQDKDINRANQIPAIVKRLDLVRAVRQEKEKDAQAQKLVGSPHRFRDQYSAQKSLTIVPIVSSENREYLPVGIVDPLAIVHNKAFALYDAPLWNMALIASRLHWVWIGTVCVRMRTDFSYSNTLGWNTFPVPLLTEKMKADLTDCAQNILLAREAHFPATIADLYDPETMPENLRMAHARNDEVLERIYIGRRFKNDTERLEKLFELYTRMRGQGSGVRGQGSGVRGQGSGVRAEG